MRDFIGWLRWLDWRGMASRFSEWCRRYQTAFAYTTLGLGVGSLFTTGWAVYALCTAGAFFLICGAISFTRPGWTQRIKQLCIRYETKLQLYAIICGVGTGILWGNAPYVCITGTVCLVNLAGSLIATLYK